MTSVSDENAPLLGVNSTSLNRPMATELQPEGAPSQAILDAEAETQEKHNEFTEQNLKQVLRNNIPYFATGFVLAILLMLAGILWWTDPALSWQAWFTLGLVVWTLLWLFKDVVPPHIVMLFAMTLLVAVTIVPIDDALSGFSSEAVISIAVLFVVAKSIEVNHALDLLIKYVLRTPTRLWEAQVRMFLPVALLSAFMSNTPLVAMMIPVVADWARRIHVPASKLMMVCLSLAIRGLFFLANLAINHSLPQPLSFAAVLGGTCTIIGTSTNLLVKEMAEQQNPDINLGFFEVGYIGIPNVLICFFYVLFMSPRLLPDTTSASEQYLKNPREYGVALRVSDGSALHNQSIEEAGLRGLPSAFLYQIQRGDEVIPAPGPEVVLRQGDLLFFSGLVDSMPEVYAISGLEPENQQLEKVAGRLRNRVLVEVVVANNSPLVGQTVRDSQFRSRVPSSDRFLYD